MFYKITFKNKLTIQDFKQAYVLLDSAFLENKISQWNDYHETIDLAEDGHCEFPKEPITESVGGVTLEGDYNTKDEFFRSFKQVVINALKDTPYAVSVVYISDSQVVNSKTEWFAIP